MQIELLFLGKTRERYLAAGIEDYLKRLRHYARLSVRVLKEKKMRAARDQEVIAAETEYLLGEISRPSLLVCLDPGGRLISSEEFASLLTSWENQGRRTVSFLLGGPLGLGPAAREAADYTLSLSPMTFTHEMARFLLAEQLYRAYTIKAGEKYHK